MNDIAGIRPPGSPLICCPLDCDSTPHGKGTHRPMVFAGFGDGTLICVRCGYELPALAPRLEQEAADAPNRHA